MNTLLIIAIVVLLSPILALALMVSYVLTLSKRTTQTVFNRGEEVNQ